MTNPIGTGGYEARTRPSERRALFDISRRLSAMSSSIAANYSYSTTTTPPPASGQIRTAGDDATLWLHDVDNDGYFQGALLALGAKGDIILLRDTDANYAIYSLMADPIDHDTYYEFTVTRRVDTGGNITPNTTIRVDFFFSAEAKL